MKGLPKIPKAVLRIARIGLALAMLAYLVISVGHTKPLERLASAKPIYILFAVIMVIIDGVIRAWNWTQLIRAMHFDATVRFRKVLSIYWTCSFLGQFVPSTIGTDALRALMASRRIGGHASAHGAAVVMLNVLNLVVGCVGGLACALWMAHNAHGQGVRPIAVALYGAAISAAAVAYWVLRSQRGLLLCVLRRMRGPWRGLRRGLRRFMHRLLVFERYDVAISPILGVALVTQITRASVYMFAGLAVGLQLPFPAWQSLAPAYNLSGMIPYSVSGYGGDQAAIVYILTGFGAASAAALAFALIVPLMTVAFNMLGGINLLMLPSASRVDPRVPAGVAPGASEEE